MDNRQRDLRIDVARGIAIILVVGGHSWLPFWCSLDFVSMFHMSLFMTISGYCFSSRHLQSRAAVGHYILHRVYTLYLPYAIGNAVYILLNNIFLRLQIYCGSIALAEQIQTGIGADPYLTRQEMARQVLSAFLFIGYSPRMGGATWFLRALFAISVIYAVTGYVIQQYQSVNCKANVSRIACRGKDAASVTHFHAEIMDFQLLFAFFLVIIWAIHQVHPFLHFGSIAQIFQYYFAYALGDFCHRHNLMRKKTQHPMLLYGLFAAGGYILLQLCQSRDHFDSVSMACLYQILTGILGWVMVYSVSQLICAFLPALGVVLSVCGQATLETLLLHFLCFKIVTEIYILIYHLPQFYLGATPILPNIHAIWGCFYIFAGIGIPDVIHFMRIKIKRYCEGRKAAKALWSILVFTFVLMIVVFEASSLLERKASVEKYSTFFKRRDQIDVLFFGTSHVVDGILPMELWGQYGITSYNCAGYGNRMPTSYWMMMETLEYARPKVVVIDGFWISELVKTSDQYSETHDSFDAFPISFTKIRAVSDLLDDPDYEQQGYTITEERDPIGMLWDFSVYHSRWSGLTGDDFSSTVSPEYGASSKIGVYLDESGEQPISTDQKMDWDTNGTEYLSRMIQECQKRDIQVILTYLPFNAGERYWEEANRLTDFATGYDIPYLNFLKDNPICLNCDLYDSAGHLNAAGAKKVTSYIGRYLSQKLGIEDHRREVYYSGWEEDYQEYETYKIDILKSSWGLDNALMLLRDMDYKAAIRIREQAALSDISISNELEEMGLDRSDLQNLTGNSIIMVSGGKNATVTATDVSSDTNDKDGDVEIFVYLNDTYVDQDTALLAKGEFWLNIAENGQVNPYRVEWK